MESIGDGDEFSGFGTGNLIEFNNEMDDLNRAHIQRKINVEMYHQACARNLPKPVVASMLHDDLVSYSEYSVNAFTAKFDEMLSEWKIDVNESDWRCTLDDSTVEVIMPRKQCQGKYLDCVNDEISQQHIALLFNPIQLESNGNRVPHNAIRGVSVTTTNRHDKDGDGNEEVITFNMNFNRRQNPEIRSNNFGFNEATTPALPNNSYVENEYKKPLNAWLNGQNLANSKRKCDEDYSHGNWKQGIWVPTTAHDECVSARAPPMFKTGLDELEIQYEKKYGHSTNQSNGTGRKTLGGRRTVGSPFVPPVSRQHPKRNDDDGDVDMADNNDRLKHIDPKMIELIRSEIMDRFAPIAWCDIAGLSYAKKTIQEAVVWPILRPDIFTGLRRPPRGILLFGPPGTGKTLIGKCIASQSKSTFFSISASSLTSKWIGEGEKMVRTLFAVAAVHQPAVIFIDEIDSLLCQRSENEHESSRRLKTEFLVQLDGACTGDSERILIVGATNRPQELDEAARRRFTKRLYIPLPEQSARQDLLRNLLKNERTEIDERQTMEIARMTNGFSGADLKVLCQEASMGPIRSIPMNEMNMVDVNDVRALNYSDFQVALQCVRASVSPNDLHHYMEWDRTYGSGAGKL